MFIKRKLTIIAAVFATVLILASAAESCPAGYVPCGSSSCCPR